MPTILLVHSTMESVDTACSFLAMRSCIRSWAAANACTCGRNTSTWMEYDWHVPLFAFVERLRAFQHGLFAFSRNPRHSCSHNDAGSDGMAAAAGPCGYAALRWLHRDPSVPSQRAAVWPRVAWHRRCATCRTPPGSVLLCLHGWHWVLGQPLEFLARLWVAPPPHRYVHLHRRRRRYVPPC